MWESYNRALPRYSKLSLVEERRLIAKAKRGCKAATEELVLRHVGFVIFRIHKKVFPLYITRFGEDILAQAVISLVAMLNKHGHGVVYFGINDNGKILGQSVGKMTLKDVTQMEVQAAVFAGTDKITFLDIKKFKGNIFSLRKQAENYIREHINWRADLTESQRKEIPEIPVRAFSEAIGNSLCHRDYTDPKGNEVAIFKDRIDIYNPGTFPDELTPDDFIKGDG
ncbi:MAG: hypothetical protein HQL24_09550 [Candidatus Omnitrophica bacterium]|nr:hypothetical protein [Candidatus Omnitrophota bacterium]